MGGGNRKEKDPLRESGFPEESHTWLSAEVLERAAASAGWRWLGALTVGGASMAASEKTYPPMEEGLERAATDLDEGLCLSQEAVDLCAKPLINPWLYRLAGGAGWLAGAWHHGTIFRLKSRPFTEGEPLG